MNNLDNFYNDDPVIFSKSYFGYLAKILNDIDLNEINLFIKVLLEARERDSQIFFIGNGGSAATASHFANDLSIGVNVFSKPFRALSLTDNVAIISALGNDYGYEEIFVKQLQVLARPGDILIGISASGNSPNLIKAFEYAKAMGIWTVGITAFEGGRLRKISDCGIHVPTQNKEYGPAEDAHMILDHLVTAYLMRLLRKNSV